MNKLDWITWKTEESELINIKEIINNLGSKLQEYNSYMNPVVCESIKYELNNGGLQKECFVIDGRSPATEVANKIISDIDEVKDMATSLIESIRIDVEEQRKLERNQLILKIEEKIAQDKRLIEKSKEAQQKYMQTSLFETSESIQVVIDIAQKRIDKLQKKLEIIRENR